MRPSDQIILPVSFTLQDKFQLCKTPFLYIRDTTAFVCPLLLPKSNKYYISRKQRLTAVGIRCADHVTLYPQKLALTSPTGGGRSVGIVRSRTKATEFILSVFSVSYPEEKRMRHIILPSVACVVLLYFSTLSHKWNDFREKVEYKICFWFLYKFCLKDFSF